MKSNIIIDDKCEVYSDLPINKIICGESRSVLSRFPDSSIDFIMTSPPYADQRFYGDDCSSIRPDNYVSWFIPIAKELYRVLKNNGSFVLNINDKTVDKFQHMYVYETVIALCKDVGFNLVRDYIWHNPSTPPNAFSSGKYGRTKKSHEYCFWFSKSKEWYFNMDPIRKEYSVDMNKYLEGRGKGNRMDNTRPSTHSFDCEKVWADKGGSDPGSVITLGNNSSNDVFTKVCKEKGIMHPARFPEKLVEFFILSGTKEGDVVLDPFSGSGTTAVVSSKYNRKWIGIDLNEDYCLMSSERMLGGCSNVDISE